jgi:phage-related protein
MALPAQFVRPSADDQLNLTPDFSSNRQRRVRMKKIFVIKKTSRLPSTNTAGKKIRHILIFDNHPESLRLVFGQQADSSEPQSTSLWELVLVAALTFGAVFGMFWPLL